MRRASKQMSAPKVCTQPLYKRQIGVTLVRRR
jgi:hypothetical protein